MGLVDDSIKKIKIRRGGVILRVNEDEVDKYFNQGFSVIDESGKVIKESVPTDIKTLQSAFINNRNEIKRLTEIIEAQENEIQALKKAKSTTTRKKATKDED